MNGIYYKDKLARNQGLPYSYHIAYLNGEKNMSTQTASTFSATSSLRPARAPRPQAPALTAALLAAVTALAVLLADRYISVLTENYLMAAWLIMWAVVFVAFVGLRPAARRVALRLQAMGNRYAAHLADQRSQARFMDMAQRDPRIMAELNGARSRASEQCKTFEEALTPLGMAGAVVTRTSVAKPSAGMQARQRLSNLYYI